MHAELVSVIIPCYQQGRFLNECISSLQSQTHKNWEALIINDGSTDETEKIAKTLTSSDARVKYIYQENSGLSSARNTGLRNASGAYIQFLDADDLLEPLKLEKQIDIFQKYKQVDIVYGNAKYFDDSDINSARRNRAVLVSDEDWITSEWMSSNSTLHKLNCKNGFPVNSPLLKTEITRKIGYFNEALKAYEDWEYWLRAASLNARFEYANIAHTDAFIRVHGRSMSIDHSRMNEQYFAFRLACKDIIPDHFFKERMYWVAKMIQSVSVLLPRVKRARYRQMRESTNNFLERTLIEIGILCDTTGLVFPMVRKIVKKSKS